MARGQHGGTTNDFVFSVAAGGLMRLAAGNLTVWSALSGGVQHTDLLLAGQAVTSIPVGSSGQIPAYEWPDNVFSAYVSLDGGATRYFAVANQVINAQAINDHLGDGVDAHDASAISFAPASGIAATDVQAAIVEAKTDAEATANTHGARVDNPHAVTKAQVGLGNVDNTSDAAKPVSTAQAATDALRVPLALVDAKGDLLVGSADNTLVRLPAGANGERLLPDSAQSSGWKFSDTTYIEGTGSPEGAVTAVIGSRYIDTAATNGAVEWVKASGTGFTGWKVVWGDSTRQPVFPAPAAFTHRTAPFVAAVSTYCEPITAGL